MENYKSSKIGQETAQKYGDIIEMERGAETLEASLMMLRMASEHGTKALAVTPHGAGVTKTQYLGKFERLKAAAARESLPVKLFFGTDGMIAPLDFDGFTDALAALIQDNEKQEALKAACRSTDFTQYKEAEKILRFAEGRESYAEDQRHCADLQRRKISRAVR